MGALLLRSSSCCYCSSSDTLFRSQPRSPLESIPSSNRLPFPSKPARSVSISMFEVPLERPPPSKLVVEDSEPDMSDLPPIVLVSRDSSSQYTVLQRKQGTRSKRNSRHRSRAPLSFRLSQGLNHTGSSLFLRMVGATSLPVSRVGAFKGVGGIFMTMVVAIVAIAAAAKKRFSINSDRKQGQCCSSCKGYGVQLCYLCKGRGVVQWEGKLCHTDPCPLCFGSRQVKCPSCDGLQFKKSKQQFQ